MLRRLSFLSWVIARSRDHAHRPSLFATPPSGFLLSDLAVLASIDLARYVPPVEERD